MRMANSAATIARAGDQLPDDARGKPAFDPEMAAAVEDDVEDQAVEPRADGDRRGEAGDPERRDQQRN